MNEQVKSAVLDQLSLMPRRAAGNAKWAFGRDVVHVRFCSANLKAPDKFKFNLNPNTLSADYELWICGSADRFYLLPKNVIHEMYHHPAAYPDNTHPNIRVVSVDAGVGSAKYARDTESLDLRPFAGSKLPGIAG